MTMTPLERALSREAAKQINQAKVIKAVRIESVDDIKRAIALVGPNAETIAKEVPMSTILNSHEDGKNLQFQVSTSTRSRTKREFLIEGMEMVKRHMGAVTAESEATIINGKTMPPIKFSNDGASHYWIDPIIKQWLGAYRSGLLICWNLGEHVYQYDVFEHKLVRVKNAKL